MVNLSAFAVVDTGHTTTKFARPFPFDFISCNGKDLVVTVGDSWTWGADMSPDNNNEYRLKNHFGHHVAQKLNADWLNLGQNGSGNFWMYDRIRELAGLLPNLKYQRIYIICTLTETGRAINSSVDIDFYSFFKLNPTDRFVEYLNNLCVDNIIQALSPFNNVSLHIGTNFVDYLGKPHNVVLPTPWLELICQHYQQTYVGNCQIVSPQVIEELRQLKDLVPSTKHNDYLQLLNNLLENALQRERTIASLPGINRLHPDAHCHRLWAEYILKSV